MNKVEQLRQIDAAGLAIASITDKTCTYELSSKDIITFSTGSRGSSVTIAFERYGTRKTIKEQDIIRIELASSRVILGECQCIDDTRKQTVQVIDSDVPSITDVDAFPYVGNKLKFIVKDKHKQHAPVHVYNVATNARVAYVKYVENLRTYMCFVANDKHIFNSVAIACLTSVQYKTDVLECLLVNRLKQHGQTFEMYDINLRGL